MKRKVLESVVEGQNGLCGGQQSVDAQLPLDEGRQLADQCGQRILHHVQSVVDDGQLGRDGGEMGHNHPIGIEMRRQIGQLGRVERARARAVGNVQTAVQIEIGQWTGDVEHVRHAAACLGQRFPYDVDVFDQSQTGADGRHDHRRIYCGQPF